jgi:hypothetical protein
VIYGNNDTLKKNLQIISIPNIPMFILSRGDKTYVASDTVVSVIDAFTDANPTGRDLIYLNPSYPPV